MGFFFCVQEQETTTALRGRASLETEATRRVWWGLLGLGGSVETIHYTTGDARQA